MKEYFSGHRDAEKINEYLNRHAEDSAEFKIVYRLRTLGEKFVAGNLSMQEVEENRQLLQRANGETMAFIQEMGGWSFYRALCLATQQGAILTPLEKKIQNEIVHPSFCKPVPSGSLALLWYKLQRIWYTRWKHPLVYREWWLPALVTKIWCRVRGVDMVSE